MISSQHPIFHLPRLSFKVVQSPCSFPRSYQAGRRSVTTRNRDVVLTPFFSTARQALDRCIVIVVEQSPREQPSPPRSQLNGHTTLLVGLLRIHRQDGGLGSWIDTLMDVGLWDLDELQKSEVTVDGRLGSSSRGRGSMKLDVALLQCVEMI